MHFKVPKFTITVSLWCISEFPIWPILRRNRDSVSFESVEKLPPVEDGERISIAQDRDVCAHVDRLHKKNTKIIIENIKARKAKDSERSIKERKKTNKQIRIEEKERRQKE